VNEGLGLYLKWCKGFVWLGFDCHLTPVPVALCVQPEKAPHIRCMKVLGLCCCWIGRVDVGQGLGWCLNPVPMALRLEPEKGAGQSGG
jgi:hypothetical protein